MCAIALTALLGKAWMAPVERVPNHAPFVFTEAIPLKGWRGLNRVSVEATESEDFQGTAVNGVRFSFVPMLPKEERSPTQPDQLTVETVYWVHTDGDLKSIIQTQADGDTAVTRYNPQLGYYSQFTAGDTSHLMTCINPRGGATVTADQFQRNRRRHDWQPSRLFAWLTGHDTLSDNRCLLTTFSLPHGDDTSEADAYEILETAWTDWTAWWIKQFPVQDDYWNNIVHQSP